MLTQFFLKSLRTLLSPLAGKKKHQALFESLHAIALQGMNIGGGAGAHKSGETHAIRYVKSQLPQGQLTLFDVGANVGLYTKLLLDFFGDTATIHSFEPSARTFEKLKGNLSGDRVKPFNFGFGETDSKITLYSNQEGSTLASVYPRNLEHAGIAMGETEEITLRSIDSFCTEYGIHHIDFLKIDVEGHEISVLKGAETLLKQGNIHFIQFEFGGCNIDSRTYFQDFYTLFKDDYHMYRIVKDGLYPIQNYHEHYEAFTTTNYLVELKKE